MASYYDRIPMQSLDTPYQDGLEYLADLIHMQDIRIHAYIKHLETRSVSHLPFQKYQKIFVSKGEVSAVFKELNHIFVMDSESQNAFDLLKQYTDKRIQNNLLQEKYFSLVYLSVLFSLTDFEMHCLILSIMPCFNKGYEKIFAYLQDDFNLTYPTIDLCVRLYGQMDSMTGYFLLKEKMLKYIYIQENPSDLLNIRLRPHEQILQFLFEPERLDFSSDYYHIFYSHTVMDDFVIHSSVLEKLKVVWDYVYQNETKNKLVYLIGEEGSGKKYLLKKIACCQNKTILFVDTKRFLDASTREELNSRIDTIVRISILLQAFLCFYNLEKTTEEKEFYFLTELFSPLMQPHVIFFCLEQNQPVSPSNSENWKHYFIEVPKLSKTERKQFWDDQLCKKHWENLDSEELADKFVLTPKQIKKVIEDVSLQILLEKQELSLDLFYTCCYKQLVIDLDGKASFITPFYTLADLILPEEQRKQLQEVIQQVQYKNKVMEEWAFSKKLSYGKGMNVLFSGSPGTGKTMAAQVLAKELKLEIYKVNLSQIVSKYIGETEKNLDDIFDKVQKSNVILFFDEMDALFGKRSEVKDSHDKHANLQTSYLLQKIEDFDGIIIMATNYLDNIDEAFLRRIRMMIHFPFPDAAQRTAIWESVFPEELPKEKLDYAYLGKQFAFSGGQIKNIALNAAFLAVEENFLGMKQIVTAIQSESRKKGRILLKEDFGEYDYLL